MTTAKVHRECCVCNKNHIIIIDEEKYWRWRGGELIQNVFPEYSADEREKLISGTCPDCWKKLWEKM